MSDHEKHADGVAASLRHWVAKQADAVNSEMFLFQLVLTVSLYELLKRGQHEEVSSKISMALEEAKLGLLDDD